MTDRPIHYAVDNYCLSNSLSITIESLIDVGHCHEYNVYKLIIYLYVWAFHGIDNYATVIFNHFVRVCVQIYYFTGVDLLGWRV